MKKISVAEAVSKIEATRDRGIVFGVTFIKRSTGERRTMSARLGVHKGVKGVGLAFEPKDHNLLCVYDMNHSFRMINLEGLLRVAIQGEEWEIMR